MSGRRRFLPLVALALLAGPAVSAAHSEPPPENLTGTYDPATRTVSLRWAPPGTGNWTYLVYRDDTMLRETQSTAFRDGVPSGDKGFVYFVVARQAGGAWSDPAYVAVPTLSCEVVTVSTSWDWPHLYVNLHEECLGGMVYDKSITWTHPQ